jgi:Fe-S-cluster-containing dehydrogenase component
MLCAECITGCSYYVTWVKWNLVSVRLVIVLVSVQDRCTVCAKWMLVSFRLEIVLILTQGKCTVCAKHTIDSEIILDTHDGTAR